MHLRMNDRYLWCGEAHFLCGILILYVLLFYLGCYVSNCVLHYFSWMIELATSLFLIEKWFWFLPIWKICRHLLYVLECGYCLGNLSLIFDQYWWLELYSLLNKTWICDCDETNWSCIRQYVNFLHLIGIIQVSN